MEYPKPRSVTEIQRFLGLTGWYRSFIRNYAELKCKLTDALKGKNKEFKLSEVMDKNLMS